jgi:hypothetical protein
MSQGRWTSNSQSSPWTTLTPAQGLSVLVSHTGKTSFTTQAVIALDTHVAASCCQTCIGIWARSDVRGLCGSRIGLCKQMHMK